MATILVTAGPTREHLDDVRFLSNGSSGRMGYALASAAVAAGHRALLVSGPTHLAPPPGAELHRVVSALEMRDRALALWPGAGVAFGAAAVADHRPARRLAGKPAKAGERETLELVRNPDVIAELAAVAGRRVVVGFALESLAAGLDAAIERARRKLVHKALTAIVLNGVEAVAAADSGVVWVEADRADALPRQPKERTAAALVARAVARLGRGVEGGA